ncbi:MAG: potassium channel protein [Acidobacteria bacterium]|nr:potassium channel protein [Acidobacteriota bacterium]
MTITAASVAGYRLLADRPVSLLDAFYMAIITLAGVGYGEIVDTSHTPALRVFNIFVVLFGVTITVYVFSVVTAFLVEGEIHNIFWRRKMQKRISQLSGHYIVCGLGHTGQHAVEELHKTGTPFVVIEHHEDQVKRALEHLGQAYGEMLYLLGDATDEDVLDRAGIDRARGVIAALPLEKDNLVITVMVRQKTPDVRIVARCTDEKFAERIMKAGANGTVNPHRIGGMRLASEVLRPHVVSFLDLMLREQSRTLRIEDIEAGAGSPWTNRMLSDLKIHERHNLLVLAVRTPGDAKTSRFWPNPPHSMMVQPGTAIIVMGDVNDIRKARQEAHHEAA